MLRQHTLVNGQIHLRVLMALAMAALCSGCLSTPQEKTYVAPVRHYGMGIAIPTHSPLPMDFQEDPQDIQTLKEFLRDDAPEILSGCGVANSTKTNIALAKEQYLVALRGLPLECTDSTYNLSVPMARDARANGSVEQVYDDLLAKAEAAMAKENAVLANFTGPGNVVEAEIVAELSNARFWERSVVHETAANIFRGYQESRDDPNNKHPEWDLANAYLNLLTIPPHVEGLLAVFHRYPWSHGACQRLDLEAWFKGVNESLNRTVNLASTLDDPDYAAYIYRPYGRLAKDARAELDYYRANRMQSGMLAIHAYVLWMQAYYENFTRDPLPSREEGLFLTASYQNHTRTLFTDEHVRGVLARVTDAYFDESSALLPLSLPALKTPFKYLRCTPADAPGTRT